MNLLSFRFINEPANYNNNNYNNDNKYNSDNYNNDHKYNSDNYNNDNYNSIDNNVINYNKNAAVGYTEVALHNKVQQELDVVSSGLSSLQGRISSWEEGKGYQGCGEIYDFWK